MTSSLTSFLNKEASLSLIKSLRLESQWEYKLKKLYSPRNFTCRGRFPVFLIEILLKIEFQWQFWILLVLRIPKHPQKVEFDEDLAELLKVKHNTSHMKNFQLFSQYQSS